MATARLLDPGPPVATDNMRHRCRGVDLGLGREISQFVRFGIAILALSTVNAGTAVANDSSAKMLQSLTLFKSDVRAVLIESCVRCHGGEKIRSNYDLTTRKGLLNGGESGVSVIAGNSGQSTIIDYLTHREEPFMPPKKPRLSKQTISAVAKWIDLGAAYDEPLVDQATTRGGPMLVTDADREYWAFAPLQKIFPDSANVDRFVNAKQKEKNLSAAPKASKSILIRRLHFDIIGLPPGPAAITDFLDDKSPDAYEKLVDQLLADPHFGERWARHWLDIARFAESHGFEHDYDRKYAFHFRDFVIRAFNQDMPYDQFVRWQLAGDELAPNEPLALMATGFLGAGVYPTQITSSDAERVRYDSMDDMLATTGSAMLATTIGCARCHDHKYDPIPTRDYYRMLSAFKSTVRTEVNLDLGLLDKESSAEYVRQHTDLRNALEKYETEQIPGAFERWSAFSDEPILEHFKARDPGYQEIVAEIAALEASRKKYMQKVMISSEGEHVRPMRLHTSSSAIPDFYEDLYFLNRGDTTQKEGVAEPGFLQVLTRSQGKTGPWTNTSNDKRTSGHRAALSHWMADVESGAGHLLARVIVNRLWQHYFGLGIVATPNNFGFQGDRPTHPELLDWLATELVRNSWRLKTIHKLILMSDAYRMGELESVENQRVDPENRFLWHRRPRRLEAEAIRDNALVVGGMLDRTMFGAGTLDETSRRRSIYFMVKRSQLVPSMQMFDWPDTLTSQGRRAVTTTPSQALVFINDPQFRQMAEGFGARIMAKEDSIGEAYMIAYGRLPSERERWLGREFVRRQSRSHNGDAQKTFTDFCGALMSANEFVYID